MRGCAPVARPVFLSPHYDDVALSCGGIVALAARLSSPLIVTVFGGQPKGEESAFARFQRERWGLDASDVVAARRREDHCAARALGATVETRWFDYLDAIYRHPAYDSDAALFGRVLPADAGLASRIAEQVVSLDASEVHVPLALGGHVDHRIVRAAARRLVAYGLPVWGYLDIPYVLRATQEEVASSTAGLSSRRVILDDDALRRRQQAVACYTSQLPVLFRDIGDPDAAVRGYLERLGDGRAAEIVYRLET